MSNLTDLLPAGAGGKQVSFVASGTIGNGITVGLNSDGTVQAVTSFSDSAGTPFVFAESSVNPVAVAYDFANNKIVIAYGDVSNSGYGTAVVGTVSGSSISFGTPTVFNNTGTTSSLNAAYDTNSSKIVLAYRDNSNSFYGTAIVGTVSGTSISFGSEVVFASVNAVYNSITYDSANAKVIISFRNVNNSNYGTSIVGTVSGTSISFGSSSVFESAQTDRISSAFDSTNNKVIIAYQDNGNSAYGTAIVGTVSGTSISFGTASVFESANTSEISMAYNSNTGKAVIGYQDNGNSAYGTAIIGAISGTSISFGTAVVFESNNTNNIAVTSNGNTAKNVISYTHAANSYKGTSIVGAVSGTSISFGSSVIFEDGQTSNVSSVYNSAAQKVIIGYRDTSNSSYGTSVVFQVAGSNNTDFIGITDAAISDTASGSVTIKGGISTNVIGLTPNQNYYVQADGTLSTTASDVLAGKALSSTSINLDYTT